ncbi:MAG TPA: YezD family protein [Sphingomonas sp.]|nr:YezD family protein [Sphingomonas sp.]
MSANPRPLPAANLNDAQIDRATEAVRNALGRLRFGTVALTVHDGRVTQIEVTEKERFGV